MSGKADIAALAYLASGVLFILALKGLSSPASSRAGNRNGMIGMTLAILTTLWVAGVSDILTWALVIGGLGIGGVIGAVMARRIAMTNMPQLVAAFHSLVGPGGGADGGRGALFAGRLRHRQRRRHPHPEPDRDEPGRRHRRHHLCGFDDRLRQAERQYERRAHHPAGAASAQSADLRQHHRADRLFHHGPAALGLLGDHGPQLRVRHHPDHSHRRRRHAGGGVDAELLFRLGGGGHRLHPGKHRADHHRRAGRLLGRDPVLHHVQGHEPQLCQRHCRRLWRRYQRPQGSGGNAARSSRARPTTPPSS